MRTTHLRTRVTRLSIALALVAGGVAASGGTWFDGP